MRDPIPDGVFRWLVVGLLVLMGAALLLNRWAISEDIRTDDVRMDGGQ